MAVILFDLDGTLIDSAPDIHAASNAVLADEGLPPLTFEQVKGFIGQGVQVLIDKIAGAQGRGDDAALRTRMLAKFSARYEEAVTLTLPYPGVPAALAVLAAAGHRMGVCTNKPAAPARAVLRHVALDGYFGAVIGGDSLPQRKPDPAPLHLAHEMLGGGPVIYVGDSEVDAETALRAGMPFALYTEGYRKTPVEALPHDAPFSDFAALPGLVAALLSEPAAG